MPKFEVLSPIKFGGKRYVPGESVDLDAKTAKTVPDGVLGKPASKAKANGNGAPAETKPPETKPAESGAAETKPAESGAGTGGLV